MATKSQRTAADKWDAEHMAYQTVKVRRELLDSFKAACAARGHKVNTILRECMERYVKDSGAGDLGGDMVEDAQPRQAVPDGEAKILKDILTR